MWERKDLKSAGKAAFKKNYWPCVLVALVMTILTLGTCYYGSGANNKFNAFNHMLAKMSTTELIATLIGISAIGVVVIGICIVIEIFVTNPIRVGGYRFFVANSVEDKPSAGLLFSAYKEGRFGKIFATMFLKDLFLVLWSLLFIVPAIIKHYSYRMVPYLLADHPEMSATEIITKSREMMKGQKWRAFVLDLSFILWDLLSIITLGIVDLFYVGPYKAATNAELYNALKD